MLLSPGEKIQVIARRRFDGDMMRHFVGEVTACTEGVARVEGYTFLYDSETAEFARRPERRVRIISLSDAGNIVTVLPAEVVLEDVRYAFSEEGRMIVTDGKGFALDVNEFSSL